MVRPQSLVPLALSGIVVGAVLLSCGKPCDEATGECVVGRPPSVTLSKPVEGAVITAIQVEVAGRVVWGSEGGAGRAEVSVDQGLTWAALAVDEGGNFAQTVPLAEKDAEPVQVQVRVTDPATQQVHAIVPVVVDNAAPRCAPVAPLELVGGNGGAPVTVRFLALDGAGIATARISVDDGETFHDAQVEEGEARWDWPIPPQLFEEGFLRVEVTDVHGNVCTDRHPVVIDTTPPTLTLISPSGMQPLKVGGPNVDVLEVRIETDDAHGIASVVLHFDDGQAPRPFGGNALERTLQVPLSAEDDHVLHEGVVRAVDPAGNVTELPLHVIVDRVAPRIENLVPMTGTRFNASALAGLSAVPVSWAVADGDPVLTRSYRTQPMGMQSPLMGDALAIQFAPADDGTQYGVYLEVRDSLGNVATAQTEFSVDVVLPAVATWSVAPDARLTQNALSLTFSETVTPLMPNANVLQLSTNPTAVVGAWMGNTFALNGLQGDTVYSAQVAAGAVMDAAGNLNAPSSTRTFHTAPLLPPVGTLLPSGVTRIEASSDEEGVLGVFVHAPLGNDPLAYRLFRVNPRTGAFEHVAVVEPSSSQLLHSAYVAASRQVVNLASDRVVGVSMLREDASLNGPYEITTWRNGQGVVTTSSHAGVLVPVARGAGEPGTAGRVGFISRDPTGTYSRTGMSSIPSNVPGRWVRALNENLWAVFGTSGSQLLMNERYCTTAPTVACYFHGATTLTNDLGATPNFSAAVLPTRIMSVFTTNAGRREACYGPVNTAPCTGFPCAVGAVSGQTALPGELFVASKNSGNVLLGARKLSGANIELLEKDVSTGCFPSWQSVAAVPNTATATAWRPVRVGDRSGVLYLEGGALKLWYP